MKPFLYKVAGALAGFAIGAVVGITGLVLYIFGSVDPDTDITDWDDGEWTITPLGQSYLDLMEVEPVGRFIDDPTRDEAWWAALFAEEDIIAEDES